MKYRAPLNKEDIKRFEELIDEASEIIKNDFFDESKKLESIEKI